MTDPVHLAGASRQPDALSWMRRSALALLALYALVLFAIMMAAAMPRSLADFAWTLVFFAWAVAPVAAACLCAYRSRNGGLAIFATLIAALAVVSGLYLYLTSMFGAEVRSTSSLIFLFLPLYQWVIPAFLLGAEGVVALIRLLSQHD